MCARALERRVALGGKMKTGQLVFISDFVMLDFRRYILSMLIYSQQRTRLEMHPQRVMIVRCEYIYSPFHNCKPHPHHRKDAFA